MTTLLKVPMCLHKMKFVLICLFLLTSACDQRSGVTPMTAVPITAPSNAVAWLNRLGGYPCSTSELTCVKLTVSLDHFTSASNETMEVVFGVLPATGVRKGTLVIASGGPGLSGLAIARSYMSDLDPAVREHFDVVVFDHRGVGLSNGIQCPKAAAIYYAFDARADSLEQETALIANAQAFAEACVRETGTTTERLKYFNTRQVVEDLEAFRRAMSEDRIWLYGESYGTYLAQMYAAAHTDRLAGLILDSPVDPTLSGLDLRKEQAQTLNEVLLKTLEACNADTFCALDMGRDAVQAYDALITRLKQGAVEFQFPLPSGPAPRTLTLTQIEATVRAHLDSENERMALQRALAAAANEEFAPLARLVYAAQRLDPLTLNVLPDTASSDASLFAILCGDYAFFSGSPAERAEAYIRAGDAVDVGVLRLSSAFYDDLPCTFWPGAENVPVARPAPLAAEGVPTLVLGATADPVTPIANAERIYRHLAEGYIVTLDGGPHVLRGRNACVDDIFMAFLVDGKTPEQRKTTCLGVLASPYIQWPAPDASLYPTPLEALHAVYLEIPLFPEYWVWDGVTPTSVGCPRGGGLTFIPAGHDRQFKLENCTFSPGFAMTGTAVFEVQTGRFSIEVTVSGLAEGELKYERGQNGAIRVTGNYGGQPVNLSR